MNNKGFTLVELIVTFAVLTVILGLSFSAVSNISSSNQSKVYETYENAMKNAAKLYVDQYSRDLWPTTSDCVKISYTALKCEDLIKDFSSNRKDDIVDNTKSYVNAIRNPTTKKVKYEIHLVVNNNSRVIYETNSATTSSCAVAVNNCS